MGWSSFRKIGLVHHDKEQASPGYNLFTTNGGDHATLIDMEGRIIHRWVFKEGISYGKLLPNGNLLCRIPNTDGDMISRIGGASGGLIELDWEGNIVWELRNSTIHHDMQRLANGNTLALCWEPVPEGMTEHIKGGVSSAEDPERILGDVVKEFKPDGSVAYEWHSWEALDVDEDMICPLEDRKEWTHGNSVCETPDGGLLVSFRRIDTVGIVDRATGKFSWKWGRGEISHQHHPTYLENGNVLLFDNGTHRPFGASFSQIVEVDPTTSEVVWRYKAEPSFSFYSHHISSAERLPNGNTLICEGASGRMFEVTSEGAVVWEYVNPFFFAPREERSNATFRVHRLQADFEGLRGKDLDASRYVELTRQIESGYFSS